MSCVYLLLIIHCGGILTPSMHVVLYCSAVWLSLGNRYLSVFALQAGEKTAGQGVCQQLVVRGTQLALPERLWWWS